MKHLEADAQHRASSDPLIVTQPPQKLAPGNSSSWRDALLKAKEFVCQQNAGTSQPDAIGGLRDEAMRLVCMCEELRRERNTAIGLLVDVENFVKLPAWLQQKIDTFLAYRHLEDGAA
jgi:hypothetical protein